jgi:hypothetical protein
MAQLYQAITEITELMMHYQQIMELPLGLAQKKEQPWHRRIL